MNSTFLGREAELNLLDRLWARPNATLLILYGRRRVGKTRLLTYWLQQAGVDDSGQPQPGRRVLYWVAEPSSALDQLRSFSQAIYNFANPQAPAPADFTYANWNQAWQQVAALAQRERLALLVDEFTYLLEIDPSIAGQWQVYYLGFARDGWTAASHAFAQEIADSPPGGKNWRALGMRLLDLSQVDRDLAAWVS